MLRLCPCSTVGVYPALYRNEKNKKIIDTPFNGDNDFTEFTGFFLATASPTNTNASKFTGGGNKKFECSLEW